MSYKLSVIIPTYNAENYLMNAINSLLKQTIGFENIEIILVDDKSTDNTPLILNELAEKYDNIKSIHLKDNTGTASEPRNIGIKNSTSDYIMFLDNDDEYYPEMCEVMYNNIIDNNVDVVTCRYSLFRGDIETNPHSFLDNYPEIISLQNINEFPELLTLGFPTMIWTKIFKKKVIIGENIKFPKGHLYEDVYFTSNFYLKADGIMILNNFLGYKYNVRINEDNKSTSQTFNKILVEKQLNGFLDVMQLIKDDKEKYNFLFNEIIVDMSKIYLYSSLDSSYQKYVIKTLKKFYKYYHINSKIHTASLPFNIVINIFISLFKLSTKFAILTSNLYSKFKG